MNLVARRLLIRGRVQGVGYRDAMMRRAEQLGVTGWVRNLRDGTVEAHLQGSADAVEALVHWARRGPALASVSEVVANDIATEDLLRSFVARPTA
ncbi:MAG TPA: acylphosphatase [Casimicrobiaceae bacterium]|nr:acylphosphatase [Casimicrobiaceae bacterium]